MYQRILIATDGTTLSKKAVRDGIGLAAAVGAKVVVLYVVARYPVSYFEGGVTISNEAVARIEGQLTSSGQAVVDAAVKAARASGIDAAGVLARSDLPAEAILAAAKKHKSDLIVMASHGRRGIKRILLGSETQQVLTHSTIAVLVLR